MQTTISNCDNLIDRFSRLQLSEQDVITIVPRNIMNVESNDQFIYRESTKDIVKLFSLNSIELDSYWKNKRSKSYKHEHSAEWIGPTFFLGAALLSENSNAISVALSVIANFLTDLFKGKAPDTTFKMEFIIETKKNKSFKKLFFEGKPTDIDKLIKLIKAVHDED